MRDFILVFNSILHLSVLVSF